MREIKFRAWHKVQKKMYSAEEMGQDQLTLMPDGSGFANISGISARLSQVDYGKTLEPMQYTGLKDKDGKEIYEGDIVSASVWGSAGYNYDDNFEVDFIKGCFCAVQNRKPLNFTCLRKTNDRKVIGNIYENGELIK